ncbi:MAG: 4-alpha-glucanotransferase [Gammaproteobacteria bacterium]|nr:4-alpha-glucanotransferase [Gammaproteobacteria bacterium]
MWGNRQFFHLEEHGDPISVADAPPDYFNATEPPRGFPLCRWDTKAQDDYRWWVNRFTVNFSLADIER